MMGKMKGKRVQKLFWFIMIIQLFSIVTSSKMHHARHTPAKDMIGSPVKLHISNHYVVVDNGIVQLTLTNPTGHIYGISYKGIDNLLEKRFLESRRGYWDIMWKLSEDKQSTFDTLFMTNFKVITNDDNKVEVSFTKTWNSNAHHDLPLNIDKRFVMLRGNSGFYSYGKFEHTNEMPQLRLDEGRIAIKLNQNLFHYMVVSDDRQKVMPTNQDISHGKVLRFREAVQITNPSYSKFKNEVEDKYQYSCDMKDVKVHGWICNNPHIGFWVITPSNEFGIGGPMKQDLTSHAGPTSLASFFSGHYTGPQLGVDLQEGEPWKKVFGPVFFYLNSKSDNNNHKTLWEDAKRQMFEETTKWPYDFPESKDYPKANERATVSGRLLVHDSYIKNYPFYAKSAYVGLALPGKVGSWQTETKGYQFWTQSDKDGYFKITGVIPGAYNLYSWVPGVIGDYKYNPTFTITQGSEFYLGDLVYNPPRNGPTLWEIGIPDRTAAEFFVPDPLPSLTNHALINTTQKFRQYGLWDRYTDLYPNEDLVYRVGVSNYTKDWFYAHVTRRTENNKYIPTTWQILFVLSTVDSIGTYTLHIALASATNSHLLGRINDPYRPRPHFQTQALGKSNAIARHGIHGLYSLFTFQIPGYELQIGENIIYLKQARGGSPFNGVMYDYIRFEGPPR
ncbi:rhamnogalacturonate lyase-like [Capsicum chacoense]